MSTKLAETVVYRGPFQPDGIQTMKFTFPPESKPLEGYTIKRAIQRGGFGEVYFALSDGGKEVALKLLQHNMDIELRGVAQCLNLKHPNLVTIFDIRTDADGDHWIVMEYVSGKSLDKVVAEQSGGMPIEEVQAWLSGMVAGLSFLHDRGIVHRDLKPANVYREDGIVKIGDVGLAKFISQSRRDAQTQSVGTVYYMAPEVAHGRYGHEVDVYSLGCVLYELLTGRVPFDGESTGEILMKHLSEKPDLSPLPRRLRPVLSRVLEKDPMRRTPSVAQLEEEFRKAILGIEITSEIPEDSLQPGPSSNSTGPSELAASEVINDHPHPGDVWEKARKKAVKEAQKAVKKTFQEARKAIKDVRKKGLEAAPSPHTYGNDLAREQKSLDPWLVVGIVVVLFFVAPHLLILGLFSFVGYCVLYGIWGSGRGWPAPGALFAFLKFSGRKGTTEAPNASVAVMDSTKNEPAASPIFEEPAAKPVAVPLRHHQRRRARHRYESITPLTRRRIPLRHRFTELTGSMVFAVFCTAVITAGVAFFAPFLADAGRIGLFALTTVLASWGALFASKLLEGTSASTMSRRLLLLLVGGVVGAAGFAADDLLLVDYNRMDFEHNPHPSLQVVGMYDLKAASQPTLAGYMLFFAGLFALRRWWWHADAFRRYRMRPTSIVLTVIVAWLWAALIGFPVPWALTYAAAISGVVHLSAAWVPQEERAALMEKSHGS